MTEFVFKLNLNPRLGRIGVLALCRILVIERKGLPRPHRIECARLCRLAADVQCHLGRVAVRKVDVSVAYIRPVLIRTRIVFERCVYHIALVYAVTVSAYFYRSRWRSRVKIKTLPQIGLCCVIRLHRYACFECKLAVKQVTAVILFLNIFACKIKRRQFGNTVERYARFHIVRRCGRTLFPAVFHLEFCICRRCFFRFKRYLMLIRHDVFRTVIERQRECSQRGRKYV